jgi:hypothetical protein
MADKDILIIKVNLALGKNEFHNLRDYIFKSKETGIIVLPNFCEVITTPKDISKRLLEKH